MFLIAIYALTIQHEEFMKTLILATLLFAQTAFAEESKKFEMVSDMAALVTIQTDEEAIQAAGWIDGSDNQQFIDELLRLEGSALIKLKKQIELENCETNSSPDNSWIDGCGEVTITREVRTSFGRGGWASAGAGYTFFVGFTSDGTGRFFNSSHMVTLLEDIEAQTNEEGDFNGTLFKYVSLSNIQEVKTQDQASFKQTK